MTPISWRKRGRAAALVFCAGVSVTPAGAIQVITTPEVSVDITDAEGADIRSTVSGPVSTSLPAIDLLNVSGRIEATADTAVSVESVGEFINAGSIVSAVYSGVDAFGSVDRFRNLGQIAGSTFGVFIDGPFSVGEFINATGASISGGTAAIALGLGTSLDAIGRVENNGRLAGNVIISAVTTGSVVNGEDGAIEGTLMFYGGTVDSLFNAGRIVGATYGVLVYETAFGSFRNSGVIQSDPAVSYAGVYLLDSASVLENDGLIEGDVAVSIDYDGGYGRIVNSGTLRGFSGTAIQFGCGCSESDDTLTLLTGSRIFGAIEFGNGADSDTLDFAGFTGNTVLDVFGLETLVPGNVAHFDFRDGDGDGQVVIFDRDWLSQHSVGQGQLDIVQGINAFLQTNVWSAGQLPAGSFTTAYAAAPVLSPAADAADSAVLSELDIATGSGITLWGGALAGGYSGAAPNAFGGVLAGAHVALDSRLSAGVLGGSLLSGTSLAAGTQTITTASAVLGAYGRGELGPVTLDLSLLAGAQAHDSRREMVAGGTTETARGQFASLFIAPHAGAALPVLGGDAGMLSVTSGLSAVLGAATGYTETGSSANLTVGGQTIAGVDGRLGLEAHRTAMLGDGIATDLAARAGLFAQINGGSAGVPVSFGGQTLTVATPGGNAPGFYAGGGIDAAMTERTTLSLDADASFRTDGRAGLSVRAGFSGTF